MSELSDEDVKRVALLSRIEIEPAQVSMFQQSLNAVLDYVSVLSEVNTDQVQPMVQAVDVSNCFREDVVEESLTVKEALSNAPVNDGTYFLVPAVLDH